MPEKTTDTSAEVSQPASAVVQSDHGSKKSPSLNLGRLFIGLFIVGVGLLYLASAASWFTWDIVLEWGVVWPIIVIALGLSLIRVRGWLAIFVGFLATLLLVGITLGMLLVVVMDNGSIRINNREITETTSTTTIDLPRQASATKAVVTLKGGAGKFSFHELSDSDALVAGTISSGSSSLRTSSRFEDGIQRVELDQTMRGIPVGRRASNVVDLGLAGDIPLDFTADLGAADAIFDFSQVMVEDLTLSAGASSLTVVLGTKSARATVKISAGASSIRLRLPRDLGVKLTVNSALSSRDVADLKRINDDGVYQSDGYDTAAQKVDITLQVGVSSLVIERI